MKTLNPTVSLNYQDTEKLRTSTFCENSRIKMNHDNSDTNQNNISDKLFMCTNV